MKIVFLQIMKIHKVIVTKKKVKKEKDANIENLMIIGQKVLMMYQNILKKRNLDQKQNQNQNQSQSQNQSQNQNQKKKKKKKKKKKINIKKKEKEKKKKEKKNL